jgi:uncharacterized protein (DUF58 family)
LNLTRLNHILIPGTKAERDRLRKRTLGRIFIEPFAKTYYALSREGRVLFVFAAIAAFAGLDVERSQNSMLWALFFSLIATAVALRRLFSLPGVTLEVAGPERVMAGQEAHFDICLENRGQRPHHSLCVEGPFLPWDGSWRVRHARLPHLPAGEARRVTLTARFDARGQHDLDSFSASALLPLRLAQGPRLWSGGTRFTVVPRVAPVEPLALPRATRYQPGGVALASITGESMELVGVRPYRNGDRIRDLHAKTWARTGVPTVREYQQEYFSRVGVVLDTDRSRSGEDPFEAAISLAAGVIAELFRGEALIDLLVSGAGLHRVTLGRSLGYLEHALDELACVEPGPHFEVSRIEGQLRQHLSRLTSVVFVSPSWDEERSALLRAVERAGVGCRAVAVCARGGAEAPALPSGVRLVSVAEVHEACETGKGIAL